MSKNNEQVSQQNLKDKNLFFVVVEMSENV